MKMKRIISMVACMSIVATNVVAAPTMALSYDQITDMPDWWSQTAVEKAVDNDILEVNNFLIRPLETLTRAEMAHGVNSVFGGDKKADLSEYTDVNMYASYYEDVQKAVALGAFSGYPDKTLRPEANITREEMFTVISKTLNMEAGDKSLLNKFIDKDMVSDWAEGATTSMLANKYIAGNANGTINPQGNITREEFAQIISNIIDKYYTVATVYTNENCGTAIINTKGVTLKDSTINGDLIIADGVGDGDVTLDNVVVTGRTIIRGGGENSIKLLNGSELKGQVIVNNSYSKVRIYNDKSSANNILLKTDAILEGDFNTATVDKELKLEVKGNVGNIVIKEKTEFIVSKGQIEKIILLENAGNTTIKGNGKLTTVEANVDNVSVEVIGTTVKAGSNVSGVTAGGKKVEAGKSVTIEKKKSSGGGGGGGGGSSSNKNPLSSLKLEDVKYGGKIDLGKSYAQFEIGYVDSCSDEIAWYKAKNKILQPGKADGSGWSDTTKEIKVKYKNNEKSIRIRPDKPEITIDKINSVINIEKSKVDKYEFCNVDGEDIYSTNDVIGKYFEDERNGKIRLVTYTDGDKSLGIRLKATSTLLESVPFELDMYSGKITSISEVLTAQAGYKYRVLKINEPISGKVRTLKIICNSENDVYVTSDGTGRNLENFDLAVNDFITVYKTYDEYVGESYSISNIYITNIVLNERNIPKFFVENGVLDLGDNYSKYALDTPENWWYMARPSNETDRHFDFNTANRFVFDDDIVILDNDKVVQKIEIRNLSDRPQRDVEIDSEDRTLTVPVKEKYEYIIGSYSDAASKTWNEFNDETINIPSERTTVYVRKKVGSLGNGVSSYPAEFTFYRKLTNVEQEALLDLQNIDLNSLKVYDISESWDVIALNADSTVSMYAIAQFACELYGMDLTDESNFPNIKNTEKKYKQYVEDAIEAGLLPKNAEEDIYQDVSVEEACELFVKLVGKKNVSNYIEEAINLGIAKNVVLSNNGDLKIGQLIVMAHNVLDVGTWDNAGNQQASLRTKHFTVTLPKLVLTDINNGGKVDLGKYWSKLETSAPTDNYDAETGWYRPTSRYLTDEELSEEILTVRYDNQYTSIRLRNAKPEIIIDKFNARISISEQNFDKYEVASMKIPKNYNMYNVDFNNLDFYDLETNDLNQLLQYDDVAFIREKATKKLLPSQPWHISVFSGKITEISELKEYQLYPGRSYEYRTIVIRDEAYNTTRTLKIVYTEPTDTYLSRDDASKNLAELDLDVDDFITIYKTYDERISNGYRIDEDMVCIDNIVLENRGIPTFSIENGILDLGSDYSKYGLCDASGWWYTSATSSWVEPTDEEVDVNLLFDESVMELAIVMNNQLVQKLQIRTEADKVKIYKTDYKERTITIYKSGNCEYKINDGEWIALEGVTLEVPDEECLITIRRQESSLGNGVNPQTISRSFVRKATSVEYEALQYLEDLDYFKTSNSAWRIDLDGYVRKIDAIIYLCKLAGITEEDAEDAQDEFCDFIDLNTTQRGWINCAIKEGLIEVNSDKFNPRVSITKEEIYEYFAKIIDSKNDITDYKAWAEEIGLLRNISSSSGTLTYSDFMIMLYNANVLELDWTFAVVDYIYDVEQDEERRNIYKQKLRLIMMDGRKVRSFNLVYDVNENYEGLGVIANPSEAIDGVALVNKVTQGALIAFKADADSEVHLKNVVAVDTNATNNTKIDGYEFYLVRSTDNDVVDFKLKEFELEGATYKVSSDTTILDKEEETTIKWYMLVDEKNNVVGADTLLIVEEGEKEISHIIALISPSVNAREFALVLDATYTIAPTKKEAKLLGVDGEEYVYEYDADTVLKDETLISYTLSGDKLTLDEVNIDLAAAKEAGERDKVNGIDKGAYLVESVESDYFTYTDEDAAGFTPLKNRILDVNVDKAIVVKYELDSESGTFIEAEFDEETIKGNYVLAFNMDDDKYDVELLVIFEEIVSQKTLANTEASDNIEKSDDIESSDNTEKSEDTEASNSTEKSEDTEASNSTEKSDNTETSNNTEKSDDTEASNGTEQSDNTETSNNTEKSDDTETSDNTEKSVNTEISDNTEASV